MSVAASKPLGPISEHPGALVLDWEPISAEELWRFTRQPSAIAANEHQTESGTVEPDGVNKDSGPTAPAADPEADPFALFGSLPAPRPFPEIVRRGLRLDSRLAAGALALADWLLVFAVGQIAALWGHGQPVADLLLAEAAPIVASALALKAGLWITGVYGTAPAAARPEGALGGLALGALSGLVLAAIAAPDARSAAALAAVLPIAAILMAGVHAAFALWTRAAWKRHAFSETVVVIGANALAERFIARAHAIGDMRVLAIVDDRADRAPARLAGVAVAGGVEHLLAWPALPDVDRLVICVPHGAEARVKALVQRLKRAPNRIDILFDYDIAHAQGRRLSVAAGVPLAMITGRTIRPGSACAKRAFDLIASALLIVCLAPLMATIACAVRLESEGPALFRQRRHGLNNRVITILKFRTMRKEACNEPTRQVCPKDPRVTRLGAFLRRTSLDELPQLFNVVRGEMSLVGPRPHAVDMRAADCELVEIAAEYAHRHRVKPGITGWAQVNGSRGPIETPEAVRRRVALDLDYVAKTSFWFDLWILLRTIPSLFGDTKVTR